MKISLCIICKDEEKKIARCINSVKEKVDEIVVVDTGSTDNTINIVKALGAKVFEIPWENDFAKARNYAISKCQGHWIVFLDADEYLLDSCLKNLRPCLLKAENDKHECILVELLNEENNKVHSTFKTIRIFKNHPNIKYEGSIHERLCKEGGNLSGVDYSVQLRVLHDGYSQEVVEEKQKANRNIEMLLKEYEKNPTSSDICYYLMDTYSCKDDVEKTLEFAEKTLAYNNSTLFGVVQTTYEKILEIYQRTERSIEEVLEVYNKALEVDTTYPDFDFRIAACFYQNKDFEKAIEYFEQCVAKMEVYRGAVISKVLGNPVNVFKILSQCYLSVDKAQNAIKYIVRILQIDPYDYATLYTLIQILTPVETGKAIGEFLAKLYDFNNLKDQIVLAQISEKTGNMELYDYIISRLSQEVKTKLGIV